MKNNNLKDKEKSKGNNHSDSDGGTVINKEIKVKGKVQIKEENNTVIEHNPNEKASKINSKLDTSRENGNDKDNQKDKDNDKKIEHTNTSENKETSDKLKANTKSSKQKEYFENIRVLIKVRPLNKHELGKGTSIYLDSAVNYFIKIG